MKWKKLYKNSKHANSLIYIIQLDLINNNCITIITIIKLNNIILENSKNHFNTQQ